MKSWPTTGNDGVPTVEEWISTNLPSGARVGFDPQLMSEHVFKKYSDALECSGQMLIALTFNLIDIVWGSERPPRPTNSLVVLCNKYSGEPSLPNYICVCQLLMLLNYML